jgi:hypothetical protein
VIDLHALSVVVEDFHLFSFVVGLLLIQLLPDQILVVGVVFQTAAAGALVGKGPGSGSSRVMSGTELSQAAALVAPADVFRVIVRTPTACITQTKTPRDSDCIPVLLSMCVASRAMEWLQPPQRPQPRWGAGRGSEGRNPVLNRV